MGLSLLPQTVLALDPDQLAGLAKLVKEKVTFEGKTIRLGASNLAMLRYEWVWYKSRATGFLNANRAPLKKSENILVFYQKSPVYHPQFTYGEPYRKTNPRSGCSTNYGKFERTGSESSDGRRYPGNVLFVPTVTGGIHPTQKPVELCEYFIKT